MELGQRQQSRPTKNKALRRVIMGGQKRPVDIHRGSCTQVVCTSDRQKLVAPVFLCRLQPKFNPGSEFQKAAVTLEAGLETHKQNIKTLWTILRAALFKC